MTETLKCNRGHVYVWCKRCGDGMCVCIDSPYEVAASLCWCCGLTAKPAEEEA